MFTKNVRSKIVLVISSLVAMPAFAELDPAVGTGISSLQTDALALIALVIPAVVAITGGFKVISLMKRGINKV